MGYKQMDNNMTFAEVSLLKSMEHNRSLKRLEKISQIINWTKVEEILMDHYTVGIKREGADAYSPLILLKALLLQKWYRIDSDPELGNQINDRISFKKFIGLSFDQHSPDHSTFSRFRGRLSKKAMTLINSVVLQQFSQKGLTINEGIAVDAQRWIIAALRNHTFFGLHDLNRAIAEKLTELNNRSFQKMEGSRRSLFETIDKPALKPLPSTPYEYAEWKTAAVNIDYHLEIDHHYYSVPYQLVRERVDVRLTSNVVEIFFKNRRVVLHQRSYDKWKYTTLTEHMPQSHQR